MTDPPQKLTPEEMGEMRRLTTTGRSTLHDFCRVVSHIAALEAEIERLKDYKRRLEVLAGRIIHNVKTSDCNIQALLYCNDFNEFTNLVGGITGDREVVCKRCGGTRVIEEHRDVDDGEQYTTPPCPDCCEREGVQNESLNFYPPALAAEVNRILDAVDAPQPNPKSGTVKDGGSE